MSKLVRKFWRGMNRLSHGYQTRTRSRSRERATAVGPAGGEVLAVLTLAVHARVPIRTLKQMIYAYPTFHRAIETALENLG